MISTKILDVFFHASACSQVSFPKIYCMICCECKVMHNICIYVCLTQICNVRRRKKTHIFDKGQCNDLLQNIQLSKEYITQSIQSLQLSVLFTTFLYLHYNDIKRHAKRDLFRIIAIQSTYNCECVFCSKDLFIHRQINMRFGHDPNQP